MGMHEKFTRKGNCMNVGREIQMQLILWKSRIKNIYLSNYREVRKLRHTKNNPINIYIKICYETTNRKFHTLAYLFKVDNIVTYFGEEKKLKSLSWCEDILLFSLNTNIFYPARKSDSLSPVLSHLNPFQIIMSLRNILILSFDAHILLQNAIFLSGCPNRILHEFVIFQHTQCCQIKIPMYKQ
jgi:hypothetical protein